MSQIACEYCNKTFNQKKFDEHIDSCVFNQFNVDDRSGHLVLIYHWSNNNKILNKFYVCTGLKCKMSDIEVFIKNSLCQFSCKHNHVGEFAYWGEYGGDSVDKTHPVKIYKNVYSTNEYSYNYASELAEQGDTIFSIEVLYKFSGTKKTSSVHLLNVIGQPMTVCDQLVREANQR